MTDLNIWVPIVGILYVIVVFWLLDGFEVLVEDLGSRRMAIIWVLAWPVFMVFDIVDNPDD
jgi:hypothetical protein